MTYKIKANPTILNYIPGKRKYMVMGRKFVAIRPVICIPKEINGYGVWREHPCSSACSSFNTLVGDTGVNKILADVVNVLILNICVARCRNKMLAN